MVHATRNKISYIEQQHKDDQQSSSFLYVGGGEQRKTPQEGFGSSEPFVSCMLACVRAREASHLAS